MMEKMYALLCGGVSDALDLMEGGENQRAADLLRALLLQTEDLYLLG